MDKSFQKMMNGYQAFRTKYAEGCDSVMSRLSEHGQHPEFMVVACSDSRVDPAVVLQCDPGDLFMVRNVANLVPPFETNGGHHGVSAALEFGVRYLQVKHLIIMGHGQCGGIQAIAEKLDPNKDDFISDWVDIAKVNKDSVSNVNELAQQSLLHSYQNCLTFPWIKDGIENGTLAIHLWFFDIKEGEISAYSFEEKQFEKLA